MNKYVITLVWTRHTPHSTPKPNEGLPFVRATWVSDVGPIHTFADRLEKMGDIANRYAECRAIADMVMMMATGEPITNLEIVRK